MIYKVRYSYSNKSKNRIEFSKIREGKEIYRHPDGRFVVLEFQGVSGKFREAFRPEEIIGMEGA